MTNLQMCNSKVKINFTVRILVFFYKHLNIKGQERFHGKEPVKNETILAFNMSEQFEVPPCKTSHSGHLKKLCQNGHLCIYNYTVW